MRYGRGRRLTALRTGSQRRAYMRAYYAEHREEMRARRSAYYAEHREEMRAKQRAYDAAHKDERRAYRAARKAGDEGTDAEENADGV